MLSKTANTAAIRIAQLKEAIAAMASVETERPDQIVSSLEEEIDFLTKQIEADLEAQRQSDVTIAQPIAPNI